MRLTLPPTNLMSKPRSISWFNHKFKSAVVDWACPETILSAVSLRKAARQIQASCRCRQSNSSSGVFLIWNNCQGIKKNLNASENQQMIHNKKYISIASMVQECFQQPIVVVQAKGKSAVVFQQSFFEYLRKTFISAKPSEQFPGVSHQERNLGTFFVSIKFYFLKAFPKGL